MKIHQKEKGFTIIEVVLVLAIAGLIFLMVFIALPALQRSQRDTQRKNDLSRATTAVSNYSSANRGTLPEFTQNFIDGYLTVGGDSFLDPSGTNSAQESDRDSYQFSPRPVDAGMLSNGFNTASTQNVIYYTEGASCDLDGKVKKAGSRTVALRMYLEGGGVACSNN